MKTLKLLPLIILLSWGCFYYNPEEDPYRTYEATETITETAKPEVKRVSLEIELLDAKTFDPVKDVKVIIVGSPLPPYTFKNGKGKITLSPGRYRLKFIAPGYKETTKEVNAVQNVSVSFYLEKAKEK